MSTLRGKTGPFVETTSTEWWHDNHAVTAYKVADETKTSGGYEKVTYGNNTPGYFKRVRQGELIPFQHFLQYEREWKVESGTYRDELNYTGGNYYHNWRTAGNPSGYSGLGQNYLEDAALSLAADRYVQDAAAKIASGNWDALTFMAEFHKVVLMFKGFLKKLLDLLSSPSWKKFADGWLEGRYGWRVLYYDMVAIEDAIQNLDSKRKRFSQKTGASWSDSTPKEFVTSWGGGVFTSTLVVDQQVRYSVGGHVVADIEAPNVSFNPLVTAWELVTFSFVIDWIVNIGRMLESWSFLSLNSGYVASKGMRIEVISTFHRENEINPPPDCSGSLTWDSNGECRETINVRVPTSVSALPHLDLNLDTLKILDIIALVIQAIRR